jgi:hypothetical protein
MEPDQAGAVEPPGALLPHSTVHGLHGLCTACKVYLAAADAAQPRLGGSGWRKKGRCSGLFSALFCSPTR